MTLKKRILFIGPLNRNHAPTGGEQYKNRLLLDVLKTKYLVSVIDTFHWRRNILVWIRLLVSLIAGKFDIVILSTSAVSAYRFIFYSKYFGLKRNELIYFVIGGASPEMLVQGKLDKKELIDLGRIIVEGQNMKARLNSIGLENVVVIPNFKRKPAVSITRTLPDTIHRFVFISRVVPEKGVLIIQEAVRSLMKAGHSRNFEVMIFGPLGMDIDRLIMEDVRSNMHYGGYLNLFDDEGQGYAQLAGFHTMLFPTFWPSEGFPGVLIDASMLSMPVIVSDWGMNTDLIEHEVNGLVIPSMDAGSLATAMLRCMHDKDLWETLRDNAGRNADTYSVAYQTPVIFEALEGA